MRFLVLGILLAFPAADLYLTARVARWTGVPIWVFLGGSFVAGLLLLRNERSAFRTRTVAALHGEQSLLRGVLDSGRKLLAGYLLILPGLMSDVLALMLLALPLNVGRGFEPEPVPAGRSPFARGDYEAINGDYRRLD